MDCQQLYTSSPRVTFEPATLEYIEDPNYLQYCPGQKAALLSQSADFSVTKADMGHNYRVKDVRSQTDHDGFHGQGVELYTQMPFDELGG